jgi:hypothetical protein
LRPVLPIASRDFSVANINFLGATPDRFLPVASNAGPRVRFSWSGGHEAMPPATTMADFSIYIIFAETVFAGRASDRKDVGEGRSGNPSMLVPQWEIQAHFDV